MFGDCPRDCRLVLAKIVVRTAPSSIGDYRCWSLWPDTDLILPMKIVSLSNKNRTQNFLLTSQVRYWWVMTWKHHPVIQSSDGLQLTQLLLHSFSRANPTILKWLCTLNPIWSKPIPSNWIQSSNFWAIAGVKEQSLNSTTTPWDVYSELWR